MHRDKGNTADSRNSDGSIQYSKGVGTNGTLVHEMSLKRQNWPKYRRKAAHNGCKRIAMFSNSAYSAVNKIVPNERAERRRWVSSQTLQKQERD
jgi:hypothetical protein